MRGLGDFSLEFEIKFKLSRLFDLDGIVVLVGSWSGGVVPSERSGLGRKSGWTFGGDPIGYSGSMGMDSSSSTDEKLELCFNGEVYPYVQELKNGGGKLAFYHDFTIIFFFLFWRQRLAFKKISWMYVLKLVRLRLQQWKANI